MSFENIKFGREDIENVMARLAPVEIDDLAFGAIQLDGNGIILRYNLAEGQITAETTAS